MLSWIQMLNQRLGLARLVRNAPIICFCWYISLARAFVVGRTQLLAQENEHEGVGTRTSPMDYPELHFSGTSSVLGLCHLPKGQAANCRSLARGKADSSDDPVRECAQNLIASEGEQQGAGLFPYADAGEGTLVYSYRCLARPAIERQGTRHREATHVDDVSKESDYWTTSIAFEQDLRLFFQDVARAWTVLELGSYQGYTSRVLSDVFKHVIAVDASDVFLGRNKAFNVDRDNIMYMRLHTRLDGLKSLRHNMVHVAMIDAEHEYESVQRDAREILSGFSESLRFLVFDDYGTDVGVLQAVTELVDEGRLRVVGGIGLQPPWAYHGKMVHHWEGVVCEVLPTSTISPEKEQASGTSGLECMLNRTYFWLHSSLLCNDERLLFNLDGTALSRGGTAYWRPDKAQPRSLWLDWAAPELRWTKPGIFTWYLEFDEACDKFAAVLSEGAVSAAGMAEEVFESVLRRIFVAVSQEWCNTANDERCLR